MTSDPRFGELDLRSLSLFSGLDEAALAIISERLEVQWIASGTDLFQQNENADALYILLSGALAVLHTAPEAAAGGALAIVQNGDLITLDVAGRSLHLHVSDEEIAKRLAKWKPLEPKLTSGYWKLYTDTVTQADEGCDLDFLRGKRGAFIPRDNH